MYSGRVVEGRIGPLLGFYWDLDGLAMKISSWLEGGGDLKMECRDFGKKRKGAGRCKINRSTAVLKKEIWKVRE